MGPVLLAALLTLATMHVAANVLSDLRSIAYPFGLDYGEGIVWQQARLIPGPRMYSASTDLPFIVFHYPPVFYLAVRLAAAFMPDMLSAGRLVSAVSTWLIVLLISGLILTASHRPEGRDRAGYRMIAITIALLTLCLDPVAAWCALMRVDMIAISLSVAGVLIAARADGRLVGTTVALLLCVGSVFSKQTEIAAGLAIFIVTLLRRPRAALVAATVAFAVGLVALGWLEGITHGGFLVNIVSYNINRFTMDAAARIIGDERNLGPFVALMAIAAWSVVAGLAERAPGAPAGGFVSRLTSGVRNADRANAARAMLVLYFGLSTLMLVTIMKSGGTINYLIEWLCGGSVLIGVLLCDLTPSAWTFAAVVAILILGILPTPFDSSLPRDPQTLIADQELLVRRIAAADKPVASEDMTLLMRAGKPVMFEPAIVTELSLVGRWDEAPLVKMIRDGGFAFMITSGNDPSDHSRRTPAVDAAMRAAYPRIQQAIPNLWLHLPP
jgi:hypothetical protein